MAKKLTHLDDAGRAKMVDVGHKPVTAREAHAEGFVLLQRETIRAIAEERVPKGEVLGTARVAGIMAAKRCGELIPLCHPLGVESVEVHFDIPELESASDGEPVRLHVKAIARINAKTGVEMEALTAASIAALTVYDMVKAVDKSAVIDSIRLLTKSGGKSGSYEAETSEPEDPPPPKSSRSSKATPRVLMGEAGAASAAAQNPSGDREALRKFMLARHLRATEWAKSAAVPINELYGYLSGRSRALSEASRDRLAKAARATPDEMFGRGKKR